MKTGDEYRFDYLPSIAQFWRSACSLTPVAGAHGGADWDTRSMIHTIGVSFTVEMLVKGMYEETIGRATAWIRGPRKTPQDEAIARMAGDYAAFLLQTPWYQYPFAREKDALWAQPVDGIIRGWERRLGIGFEFMSKVGYAKMIEGAVAATAPAQLEIRSVIAGLDAATLASIDGVKMIGARGEGIEIETPRYDRFTRILVEIAHRGGRILDIAGNDEIMVSLTVPANAPHTSSTPPSSCACHATPSLEIACWSTSRCGSWRPSSIPMRSAILASSMCSTTESSDATRHQHVRRSSVPNNSDESLIGSRRHCWCQLSVPPSQSHC